MSKHAKSVQLKSSVKAVKPAFRGTTTNKVAAKSAVPKQAVGLKQNKIAHTQKMAPQTGGQVELASPDKMDANLKKKSPWYSSLRDPIQGAGAKIPDETGINTATMQLVQKVSVPVNPNGTAGLEIVTPYINQAGPSSTSSNFRFTTSLASANNLAWTVAGAFSNATSMQSIALAHRVVSAAVYGEYEGTTLNDSGDVTAYVLPYAPNAVVDTAVIQSRYASSVVPVNKARTKPVVARWYPINVNDRSYKDFESPTLSTFGIGAARQWAMGLIYNGVSGAGSVIFTIVVNYEILPSLNTIDFISPTPSPIDPIEEQLVQQWTQEDTQTGIASNKMVDVQPGSQVVEAASQGMNAEGGFGMLGSILMELAPTIIGALI